MTECYGKQLVVVVGLCHSYLPIVIATFEAPRPEAQTVTRCSPQEHEADMHISICLSDLASFSLCIGFDLYEDEEPTSRAMQRVLSPSGIKKLAS
jgi:hypothetical protein